MGFMDHGYWVESSNHHDNHAHGHGHGASRPLDWTVSYYAYASINYRI